MPCCFHETFALTAEATDKKGALCALNSQLVYCDPDNALHYVCPNTWKSHPMHCEEAPEPKATPHPCCSATTAPSLPLCARPNRGCLCQEEWRWL